MAAEQKTKATTPASTAAGAKRVLMVFTSVDKDSKGNATGWYLPEAAHPYDVFKAAGFAVTLASIKGGKAPVDPASVEAYKADASCVSFLKSKLTDTTVAIADCKASDYDA
jgi:putative intracellular protease/amidase